jgi:hypothetical protein
VGYLMALISALLLARLILDMRRNSEYMQRVIAPTLTFRLVATAVFTIGFWIWPAIGLVIGAFYGATRDAAMEGLGSPSVWFTLVVLLVTVPQIAVATILMRRPSPAVIAHGVAFVIGFGWVMPWLAESGN